MNTRSFHVHEHDWHSPDYIRGDVTRAEVAFTEDRAAVIKAIR